MVLQQNWFLYTSYGNKNLGKTLKVHFSLFHFECLKNVPFQRSGQCSISIPAENLKIPQVFWRSEEVWKTNIVLQWDIMASKSCAKIFGPRCCSSISTLSVSWKIWSNISKENLNPSQPNPGRREKINLSLYFHSSLRCLKVFMKAFKVLIKPCGTTKKCENKNLS